jgi:HEAT repeat protein
MYIANVRCWIFCGLVGLSTLGCNGGDPVPRRIPVQEPVSAAAAAAAAAAAESGDGVPLLGTGAPGERVLAHQRTAEQNTIDALARIGAPSVPALVAVLRDPDAELRRDAARALARMGSDASEAVPDLIAALDDKDQGVRRNATRALGEIGPAASNAVPALIKELRQNAKASEKAAQAAADAAREQANDAATPFSK